MKKTCDGCKALKEEQYKLSCVLNYKMDNIKGIPYEDCPKPKTLIKLCEIQLKNKK